MHERTQPLFSSEGYQQGLAFQLRATDIVIAPYSKSGTTWAQQIVHTLRTRGDMDFDDISRVIPWIEANGSLGLDLNAEQRAEPRAFKSHLGWDLVPKGGRYINIVRDPGDVVVSLFKFQEGWFLEPGSVPIDEFACANFLQSKNYFKHLRSWWPRRNDADVLFLAYEKMLKQPTHTIQRIADFIGIELDDDLLQITQDHSSLQFMLHHKDRFDDAMIRKVSEDVCHLPPGSDSAKVREGKAGSKVMLSAATLSKMDRVWQEEITDHLGYKDYASLIEDLV